MHDAVARHLVALLDHGLANAHTVARILANFVGEVLVEGLDAVREEPRRHAHATAAQRGG